MKVDDTIALTSNWHKKVTSSYKPIRFFCELYNHIINSIGRISLIIHRFEIVFITWQEIDYLERENIKREQCVKYILRMLYFMARKTRNLVLRNYLNNISSYELSTI